jgi:hypothetical protein
VLPEVGQCEHATNRGGWLGGKSHRSAFSDADHHE